MMKLKREDSCTDLIENGASSELTKSVWRRPAECAEAVGGSSYLELEPLRVLREGSKHGTSGVAGLMTPAAESPATPTKTDDP